MYVQNLIKFYLFVLKILSGKENLKSMKGHALILSISMHIQNLVKLYQLVLKILSGNEILNTIPTSVKGLNSVTNVRKMICNNPILDLDNIYVYTKFGKSLLFCSQDIERKQIYDGRNDENTE